MAQKSPKAGLAPEKGHLGIVKKELKTKFAPTKRRKTHLTPDFFQKKETFDKKKTLDVKGQKNVFF
jgi:hypothetical protein